MNYLLEVCLVALTLTTGVTPSFATQSSVSPENSSFTGTWDGRMNNLPEIQLKIQATGRKAIGSIVFYFQERHDPNSAWHVAGESAAPLMAPNIEGKTLTFEVQHYRCHGCTELGPNIKFRMTLAGSNQARLWNLSEGPDSDPGLMLVRKDQTTGSLPPAMRKGISVELPVTSNAVPVLKADNDASLIVTVTHNGSVYLGMSPITPTELAEKVRSALSGQAEKTLYIKADARTPYASLIKVLDSVRPAGVEGLTLLTAQRYAEEPGTLVPPKGLEMIVVSPRTVARSDSGTQAR